MALAREYWCPPDVYDAIYSDITDDIPFWVAQAKGASGRVLELCCGTGRILIPCLEAGVQVEGLDGSGAMLDHLRSKLFAAGLEAEVANGDMRDFTRRHRYALIFIAFNSFHHNLTAGDQLTTLRCCREHLEPNGRLMLNVFHPKASKLVQHDGVPRVFKTVPHPAGGTARVTDAGRCDPVEQHVWMTRKVERLDPAGRVTETYDLSFEVRYVYKPEMELLLTLAGFQRFQVQGGYAGERKPEEGDHLVWTAWKE